MFFGNKTLRRLTVLTVAALFGASIAQAQTSILNRRCEEDSLDIAPAVARGNWAINCGYIPASKRAMMDTWNDGTADAGRPLYPIFLTQGNDLWIGPTDAGAACNKPAQYDKVWYCTASCYTPEQLVMFENGYVPIATATDELRGKIVTLEPEATLDRLTYQLQNVDHYAVSARDVEHEIVVIKTRSGGQLRVTINHPLILSDGRVMDANRLEVGQALVRADGSFDAIEEIGRDKHFGKVYNVAPAARDRVSNVLVAQGFLSGSNRFQNWIIDDLNRQVFRKDIADELVD